MFERSKQGIELHPDDQAEVLRSYLYRQTVENHKAHPVASRAAAAGTSGLRVLTDAEWLKYTKFAVKKDGRLDPRVSHCVHHHPDYSASYGIAKGD